MDSYIILSLICMLFFGVNAILYKIAPVDSITLTLISFSVSAIGILTYWLFFVEKKTLNIAGIGIGVLAGLTSVIALVTFIAALKLGNASIVNTIRALSAVITVILAIIFLGEKLTIIKGTGIVFAIISVFLLSI